MMRTAFAVLAVLLVQGCSARAQQSADACTDLSTGCHPQWELDNWTAQEHESETTIEAQCGANWIVYPCTEE